MSTRGEGRTATLFTNVTDAEKERVQHLARARGVSASDYVRDLLNAAEGRRTTSVGERLDAVVRAYFDSPFPSRGEVVLADALRASDLTSDLGGLMPTLVAGDVAKFVDAARPVVNISRRAPIENVPGTTVEVPVVTQRATAVVQSSEGGALSSQKLTVTADAVAKGAYGGFVTLTEQDADWSTPSFMQIVSEDLADAYGVATEAKACADVAAAATNTVSAPASWTSAANVHAALVAAAANVRSTSKRLADVLLVGGTSWDRLLGLQDTTGEPAYEDFPNNVAGMTVVYSPGFSATFIAACRSDFVQTFEHDKGVISLEKPSSLTIDVAYRGYFATRVRAEGLCTFA